MVDNVTSSTRVMVPNPINRVNETPPQLSLTTGSATQTPGTAVPTLNSPANGIPTQAIHSDLQQALSSPSRALQSPEAIERYQQLQSVLPQLGQEGGVGEHCDTAPADPQSIPGRYYTDCQNLSPQTNPQQRIDLSTPQSRQQFVNSSTQLHGPEQASTRNGCAAACIVNGSVLQGQHGVERLIDTIEARGNESGQHLRTNSGFTTIQGYDQLDDIRQRARNNQLTRGDVETLQNIVYHQLRHIEVQQSSNGVDNTEGIHRSAVQEFMRTPVTTWGGLGSTTHPMQEVFGGNMNIRHIDSDPNNEGAEHYVLGISSHHNGHLDQIYDPWPHRNQNQILTQSNDVQNYLNATYYTINGSGFGQAHQ